MGALPRSLSVENLETRLNLSHVLTPHTALDPQPAPLPRTQAADYATNSATKQAVISLTDVVSAPAAASQHQLQGPIQAISWGGSPAGATNLNNFIAVNLGYDPVQVAKATQSAPPGQACLFIWDQMIDDIFNAPAAQTHNSAGASTGYLSPWMDSGIAAVKQRMDTFFSQFYAAGGRADYVIMDMEGGLSACRVTPQQTAAIFADPRFPAWQAANNIPSLSAVLAGDVTNYNAALMDATAQVLNQAVFNVAQKYFPDVKTSNYDMYAMSQNSMVPDAGGYQWVLNSGAGNENAPSMYGNLHIKYLPDSTPYTDTAFHTVLWETNVLRGTLNSSTGQATPWLAFKGYADSNLTNSPYYDEMVYQLALSGSSEFLLWNPRPWIAGQNPAQYSNDAQDMAFNSLLQTLNNKFGDAVRTPVTTQLMDWNNPLVVSGMQIGNTDVLYRVTVPPGVQQVKVVQTGEVLNLNGAAGVWYESTPGSVVTFEPVASSASMD